MKMKNILLGISMVLGLVLAMQMVSAADISYDVFYGELDDDGNLVTTSTAISGLNVEGYLCADVACTTVGAQVPGLTTSTSTSTITVAFPTVLQSPYGYTLYFYKADYIGWEQWADWAGVGSADGADIYLTKKQTGWAPIMGLTVDETVPTGRPIEVNALVSVDADTYSAIERTTATNIPLSETVLTEVTLNVYDRSGVGVYSDSSTYTGANAINVPYSGSLPVSFTVPAFTVIGDYRVEVTTDVTDAKILNSITQEAESTFEVIPVALVDYTYSNLDDLEYSPEHPEEGDTIVFTFDYASFEVDASDVQSVIDTDIKITIYRNGDEVKEVIDYGLSSGTYTYNYFVDDEGSYRIVVEADPETNRVNGAFGRSDEVTFIVGRPRSSSSSSGVESDEDEEVFFKLTQKTDVDSSTAIDLSGDKDNLSLMKKIIWILLWLIIILLVLILVVYLFKRNGDRR